MQWKKSPPALAHGKWQLLQREVVFLLTQVSLTSAPPPPFSLASPLHSTVLLACLVFTHSACSPSWEEVHAGWLVSNRGR
ncbi:hypothetical protein BX600DRAFT_151175 [Xylariales sp. PMI_506]|nr:hypothetical protein BX600DRAFT_151175 [Xylariales sp. PMI_506]